MIYYQLKNKAEVAICQDKYEDALGSYLVKLNNKDLTQTDNRTISIILHCINDFERISDHAVNIMESAKEMHDKGLKFSDNAIKEFDVFKKAVHKIVHMSVNAYIHNDLENAKMVEPLEQVINGLNAEMKQRHIRRLRKGKCTIELGLILSDLTMNYERVADHCSNIAVYTMQLQNTELEEHSFTEHMDAEEVMQFEKLATSFKMKYQI